MGEYRVKGMREANAGITPGGSKCNDCKAESVKIDSDTSVMTA